MAAAAAAAAAQDHESFPKAVLYMSNNSVWASVPRLAFIEKGYSESQYEERVVDLMSAENLSPSYLRINEKGSVPTLVVPLAETAGQEVATKFRALTDSIEIAAFIDASRSPQILEIKGESDVKPAPMLSPATIEGKAANDALIKLVHEPACDPNALLLAARTTDELEWQRNNVAGPFCRTRQLAMEKYRDEAKKSSSENPRAAATSERLAKWYNDKIVSLAPVHEAYLNGVPQAEEAFVQNSQKVWAAVADALVVIEGSLQLPFALGDQISLADLHVGAWLARIFSIAQKMEPSAQNEIGAMGKALQHPCLNKSTSAAKGLGERTIKYWQALKERESFKKVYAGGLH